MGSSWALAPLRTVANTPVRGIWAGRVGFMEQALVRPGLWSLENPTCVDPWIPASSSIACTAGCCPASTTKKRRARATTHRGNRFRGRKVPEDRRAGNEFMNHARPPPPPPGGGRHGSRGTTGAARRWCAALEAAGLLPPTVTQCQWPGPRGRPCRPSHTNGRLPCNYPSVV